MSPGLDLEGLVQQVVHGQALQHQHGGLLVGDHVRQLHQPVGRHDAFAGIAAEPERVGDAVAGMKAGHARTDVDDIARGFVAGDERQRRRLVEAGAEVGVDEVQAAGALADVHLALAGCGNLDVLIGEDLRPSRLMHPYRLGHLAQLP